MCSGRSPLLPQHRPEDLVAIICPPRRLAFYIKPKLASIVFEICAKTIKHEIFADSFIGKRLAAERVTPQDLEIAGRNKFIKFVWESAFIDKSSV